MSQQNAVTVELLRDLLEAFNAHDLDGIMTFWLRVSQACRTCTTAATNTGYVAIRQYRDGC